MISWNDVEKKWRAKWTSQKEFEIEPDNREKKFITVAYPYPNSPQHIGHGQVGEITNMLDIISSIQMADKVISLT